MIVLSKKDVEAVARSRYWRSKNRESWLFLAGMIVGAVLAIILPSDTHLAALAAIPILAVVALYLRLTYKADRYVKQFVADWQRGQPNTVEG